MPLFSEMTLTELLCCAAALGIQSAFLILRRGTAKKSVLLTLIAVFPAALFSSAFFTQFLSWDESYIFYDIINFNNGRLRQWNLGAFRTTTTILGPLFGLIQKITGITKDVTLVCAKAAHWIIGVFLINLIIDQTHRLHAVKVSRGLFQVLIFNAVVLMPVTGLALKTLNYDLNSMLFGVLGCVWLAAGMQSGRKVLLFASIGALTLASHEKLIASPLLWLSLFLTTARLTCRYASHFWGKTIYGIMGNAAMTSGIALTLIFVSFALVKITHDTSGPALNPDQLFVAFEAGFWPIKHFLGEGAKSFLFSSRLQGHEIMLFKVILIYAAVSLGAFLTYLLYYFIHYNYKETSNINKIVSTTKSLLLTFVITTGIVSTYCLDTRIWPHIPVSDGHHTPGSLFNGIALHYNAQTFFTHIIASVGWACAVFINAFPTVLLVLLLASSIFSLFEKKYAERKPILGIDLLAIFFLSAPFLYGALQIPLYPRYFNLFLLGTVITFVPGVFSIPLRSVWKKRTVTAAVLILLFIEVVPFQPLGSAFRPVWANYSEDFHKHPAFGKVSPWYPGWGEELYVAFRKLEKLKKRERIRIYHNFPGSLIRTPENVSTYSMPIEAGRFQYSYDENDFYLLSRNGISTYPDFGFPHTADPLFTIETRGFVKAWIFRGKDLKAAEFKLYE
ncbi:MAG: hypothetical protein ACLFQB_03340 [Chitinispirillaceae bacterium]